MAEQVIKLAEILLFWSLQTALFEIKPCLTSGSVPRLTGGRGGGRGKVGVPAMQVIWFAPRGPELRPVIWVPCWGWWRRGTCLWLPPPASVFPPVY